VIARAIRLILASGFLAAVAHVAPVAERAALGITRVEDLPPEAIARPLGNLASDFMDMSGDLRLAVGQKQRRVPLESKEKIRWMTAH
jgi:hypothetical protein